jgi:hypothetical protein
MSVDMAVVLAVVISVAIAVVLTVRMSMVIADVLDVIISMILAVGMPVVVLLDVLVAVPMHGCGCGIAVMLETYAYLVYFVHNMVGWGESCDSGRGCGYSYSMGLLSS